MRVKISVCMVMLFGLIFMALPSGFAEPEDNVTVIVESEVEILGESYVSLAMDELRLSDPYVQKADQFLTEQGFTPASETIGDNLFGIKQTYNASADGEEEEETYQLFLQEYSNPASNNTTAVGRMSIKSADGTYATEYTFILEAPKENVSSIEESYVGESDEGLEVVAANSWWTCILGQLPQIGEECQSGVATCRQNATSIVGYIGCVATNCGPSFSKHSACCNCGCSRWCSWAFGCCHM